MDLSGVDHLKRQIEETEGTGRTASRRTLTILLIGASVATTIGGVAGIAGTSGLWTGLAAASEEMIIAGLLLLVGWMQLSYTKAAVEILSRGELQS